MLTQEQIDHFEREGFLVVKGVTGQEFLDPVAAEYGGVLDRLADGLVAADELTSTYPELPFGERVTKIYAETGRSHAQAFDFSLPFGDVTEETPFWAGPAVLGLITAEPILDVVESLIGPEIYSNPVQHVRIKPPEKYLPVVDGRSILPATEWHQDNGVVTAEADDTDILTVWFSLTDTPVQMGCLKLVPKSKHDGLLRHCLNYSGPGTRVIPEQLFAADEMLPVPTERGDLICMHRQTVHGSLPNLSDRVRWSFDLRYNPIGQPTGRDMFPGFVARSRETPEREFRDADAWHENWAAAKAKMAQLTRDGKSVPFGRWIEGHPDCA
jgi:phytanoyl-CoA hydroxylase